MELMISPKSWRGFNEALNWFGESWPIFNQSTNSNCYF